MIGDIILIVIAVLIVYAFCLPFVKAFSKWKKEMEAEDGEEDVSDR